MTSSPFSSQSKSIWRFDVSYPKAVNYKLLFILILSGLIPAIYSTSRVYFLGSIPDTWAFSIAAQVAWLNVGYEVINEAMLIPLAYVLAR